MAYKTYRNKCDAILEEIMFHRNQGDYLARMIRSHKDFKN